MLSNYNKLIFITKNIINYDFTKNNIKKYGINFVFNFFKLYVQYIINSIKMERESNDLLKKRRGRMEKIEKVTW